MSAGLAKPLIRDQIEQMSEEIFEKIDYLIEAVQLVEEYEAKLGSKEDTHSMRKRMKEDILKVKDNITASERLMKLLKELELKKKEDIDQRNKVLKRIRDTFNKQNEKFSKLLHSIQNKEKVFGEIRDEKEDQKVDSSYNRAQTNSKNPDLTSQAQLQVLDSVEVAIKERERDLQNIRTLTYEINQTAQLQNRRIQEQNQEIDLIGTHTNFAEKNTDEANKELKEAEKNQAKATIRNLIVCIIILVACVVVVVLILTNGFGL